MGLRETFYNWAKQYDSPEILNEGAPTPDAQSWPGSGGGTKQKRSTTSFAAASPYNPTIPPVEPKPGSSAWYDMHPIPSNWLNLLNNMGIDWNTYPINWSGILPFLHEGPEGTWSGQDDGGITYTVQAFFGVTGEFVGWVFS